MTKSEIKEPKEEILINKMYSGYNLDKMLGHEAINLVTDDKGNNYIYVLSNGSYGKIHYGKIKQIFLIRSISEICSQVLGVTSDFESILENEVTDILNSKKSKNKEQLKKLIYKYQIEYIKNNKITINGELLNKYYLNNPLDKKEEAIYITFKANDFRVPTKNIYLVNKQNGNKDKYKDYNGIVVEVDNFDHKNRRLHNFYSNKGANKNYEKLNNIALGKFDENYCFNLEDKDKKSFWISKNKKEINCSNETYLEFMGQIDSETVFTNMIVKILKKYPNIFKKLSEEILNVKNINVDKVKIKKEVSFFLKLEENTSNKKKPDGRIDILIEDENNVIVIENKIKSDINGKVMNENNEILKTQLNNYITYINQTYKNYTPHYFIFSPGYNNIKESLLKIKKQKNKEDILDNYRIITYKDLYEFFNRDENKTIIGEDSFYKEFVNDLSIHAKPLDEYHFDLMMRKFSATIEQASPKDK